ncbi:hypothetical protein HGRIS_011348 [Hohenbuehelia grisea]|uniref:Uncharacterized protein n=1 Tax=Hohenbuehelia grisea TaxID=104357 RepID=A0ABR3JVW6_9AGAR
MVDGVFNSGPLSGNPFSERSKVFWWYSQSTIALGRDRHDGVANDLGVTAMGSRKGILLCSSGKASYASDEQSMAKSISVSSAR